MPPGGWKKGGGWRAIYTYQEKKRVRRDKHSTAVLLKSDKWSLEMTGSSLSAQTASWHTESPAAAGQRCQISMYMWNAADMSSRLKWKCVLKERHRERERSGQAACCMAVLISSCKNLLGIQKSPSQRGTCLPKTASHAQSQIFSIVFFFFTLNAHQPHLAASFNPAHVLLV